MKRILCLLVAVTPVTAYADKDLSKNGTWDCKKDSTVHIANGSGKYTFKGKCKLISVGGGENRLSIDSVETLDVGGGANNISAKTVTTLTVGGAENQIAVTTLGSLDVSGTENKIVFKKALKGDVKVTGQVGSNTIIGVGNKVIGTPGGTGTGSAAPAEPAAPSGNTIDCAKTPAFADNDNDGEFTLTGTCDSISINGNNVKVKAESAKSVSLDGNNNKVDVITVDSIKTNGNNNSVTYKKAITANAKVKISNPGNGNVIKLMK